MVRISNFDYLRFNFSESGEDDFEVVVGRDRVELANEENVFRRRDVGVRKIADHLQDGRLRPGLLLSHQLRYLLLVHPVVVVLKRHNKVFNTNFDNTSRNTRLRDLIRREIQSYPGLEPGT